MIGILCRGTQRVATADRIFNLSATKAIFTARHERNNTLLPVRIVINSQQEQLARQKVLHSVSQQQTSKYATTPPPTSQSDCV